MWKASPRAWSTACTAWTVCRGGTKLAALEDTIKAVRQVLCEKMLDEALQRQAQAVDRRPADLRCCPKCGKEVERDPERDDSRILQTDVGEAEWTEPATCCRKCRRSFSPSDPESGGRPLRVEPDGGVALRRGSRLRGTVRAEGWAEAEQAKAQR